MTEEGSTEEALAKLFMRIDANCDSGCLPGHTWSHLVRDLLGDAQLRERLRPPAVMGTTLRGLGP